MGIKGAKAWAPILPAQHPVLTFSFRQAQKKRIQWYLAHQGFLFNFKLPSHIPSSPIDWFACLFFIQMWMAVIFFAQILKVNNTVEAKYEGRLYKGTAAYRGTLWKERIFSYLFSIDFYALNQPWPTCCLLLKGRLFDWKMQLFIIIYYFFKIGQWQEKLLQLYCWGTYILSCFRYNIGKNCSGWWPYFPFYGQRCSTGSSISQIYGQ